MGSVHILITPKKFLPKIMPIWKNPWHFAKICLQLLSDHNARRTKCGKILEKMVADT